MFILSSGLTAEKTPPPAAHLAYHKKVGYYYFQELHVKSVEAVGFETPEHQISHFSSIVVNTTLVFKGLRAIL